MSPRQLIVLGVAFLAAIGALLLIRGTGGDDSPAKQEEVAIAGEQVLVATRDISQGAALTPSDIAWRLFPTASVNNGFIRASEDASAQAEYVGAVTRRAFLEGEPITQGSVIQPDGRGFMAAQLPPGYRAVAVEVESQTMAGGYIQPNDRVDVIATQTIEINGPNGAIEQVRSDILLVDVRVLALDAAVSTQESGDAPQQLQANVVVLELSAPDARLLQEADGRGDISLALRGVEAEAPGMRPPSAAHGASREGGAVRVHAFGSVSGGGS